VAAGVAYALSRTIALDVSGMVLAPLSPLPRMGIGPPALGRPLVDPIIRIFSTLTLLPRALACSLTGPLRTIGLGRILWARPKHLAAAPASAL